MKRKFVLIIVTVLTFYAGRHLGRMEGWTAAQSRIVWFHNYDLSNVLTSATLGVMQIKHDADECYAAIDETIEKLETLSTMPVDPNRDVRRFILKLIQDQN